MTSLLSADDYDFESWGETFPEHKVSFDDISHHSSWDKFFENEDNKEHIVKIEKALSNMLKKTNGEIKIFPYPDLVFNALSLPIKKVKVVILGQDPYFNCRDIKKVCVPEAMGLSFSVPVGIPIPSSLQNIYKNQQKFGNIKEIPKHGNLTSWVKQGCLMLNTSLTVQHKVPNSHAKYWLPLTDNLIKYISHELDHVVFVLWGAPALNKLNLIDTKKHATIISSHPSGLSCNNSLKQYGSFVSVDHFGEINAALKKFKKKPIDWQIV